jgi:hypothetical protein
MYSNLDELNKILIMFKNKRKHGEYSNLYSPCLNDLYYIKRIQILLSTVLNCKVWYGGSLSMFLQKKSQCYGDLDIITEKIFTEDELPWKINNITRSSYQIWDYDLDIFFNSITKNNLIDFFKQDVIKINNILVQDWKIVNAVNWRWRNEQKKREFIEPSLFLKNKMLELFSIEDYPD